MMQSFFKRSYKLRPEYCGPGAQGQGAADGCGLLSGWALRLFRGKSLEEIREISFEIGMLGRHGLDINDPQETHVLRALPGRVFSALELVCIMYAGFKRIEPGMDIGVDLGEEWGMAERLGRESGD